MAWTGLIWLRIGTNGVDWINLVQDRAVDVEWINLTQDRDK